jgi:PAS domain S-box-containing protein
MESEQGSVLKNRIDRLRGENQALREKLATLKKENGFLQRSLRDNSRLLKEFPGPMALIQEREIVLINEATLNQLGYAEEEILGRTFLDFIHPRSFEYVRALHQKRIAGKSVPDQYETYLSTKSGEAWSCEIRVKKIRYKGKRAFLVNLIGLDQRKQKETLLRQSEKMEALARMASGLNREFSNFVPFLIERVLLHQDMESTANKMPAPLAKKIGAAVELGNLITQKLCCLTKSKNERSDIALLDLKKIVKDAVAITRPKWKEYSESRGVKINVKTYLRIPSPVEGHPTEIRDVFAGMISNAIDALPNGGEIHLTTEESAGFAHAYIQDDGVGISDDIKDKIFDPFFTTKNEPRLGLGLSLARAIITRHGGEIELISQRGQGTTFIVKLPLAQQNTSPRPRRAKNRIRNSLILILAGDGIVKDLFSQLFQSKGGKIITASNSIEGLKILRKNKFDLVVATPEKRNLEPGVVIPKIKKFGGDVPIVLVNTEEGEYSHEALQKLGADVVIGRPLNMPRILSLVSEALVMKSQLGELFE